MSAFFLDDVLFNDGEGLDYNDLNDLQRFMKIRMLDGMIAPIFPGSANAGYVSQGLNNADAIYPTTDLCYVMNTAHAKPYAGAGNRQIKFKGGVIFQSLGAPDGSGCKFIPYFLDDGEIDFTLALESTSYRIDLIQIKLTPDVAADLQDRDFEDATTHLKTTTSVNKKNRTTLTAQVVQGTSSATPVKPAISAGFVPLCYVLVTNGYASPFIDISHFMDVRIPARVRSVHMGPEQIVDLFGGGFFTRSGGNGWVSAGSGNGMWITCPAAPNQRILNGRPLVMPSGTPTVKLQRCDLAVNPVTTTDLDTTPPIVNQNYGMTYSGFGFTPEASALWGGGYGALRTLGEFTSVRAKLTASSAGEVIQGFRWLIAG